MTTGEDRWVGIVEVPAGSVWARQLYHPFGTVRYSEGTLPTDFGFTGQRNVPGTGLMYYKARYYHSALGRFVSADTVVPEPANPQSLNRYSYVRNNALKYTDPSGHYEICRRIQNWLQVQYENLQYWLWEHAGCGMNVDPACGGGQIWQPPTVRDYARRIEVATGSSPSKEVIQAAELAQQLAPVSRIFGKVQPTNLEEWDQYRRGREQDIIDHILDNELKDVAGEIRGWNRLSSSHWPSPIYEEGFERDGWAPPTGRIMIGPSSFELGYWSVVITLLEEHYHHQLKAENIEYNSWDFTRRHQEIWPLIEEYAMGHGWSIPMEAVDKIYWTGREHMRP